MYPTSRYSSFLISRSFLCAAVLLLQSFRAYPQSDASVVIPKPQPAAVVPPPDPHPITPFVAAPDPQQIEGRKPIVKVFRSDSDAAQKPKRFGPKTEWILIVANEPVTVSLKVDRSLAGKSVGLLAEEGITVAPGSSIPIDSKGEAVLSVVLDATLERGQVLLDVSGVSTALRFQQAPLWAVEKKEQAIAGGGQ